MLAFIYAHFLIGQNPPHSSQSPDAGVAGATEKQDQINVNDPYQQQWPIVMKMGVFQRRATTKQSEHMTHLHMDASTGNITTLLIYHPQFIEHVLK